MATLTVSKERDPDDWATTPRDFARFSRRYGPFTLDVAAAPHNTKCERYFTVKDDGLSSSWKGERVWCNPPFSSIEPWIKKAWLESKRADGIVMLLPASRTEQPWWHRLVEPYRDRPRKSPLRVVFLPRRIGFLAPGQSSTGRTPFGCCLLIWRTSVKPPPIDHPLFS